MKPKLEADSSIYLESETYWSLIEAIYHLERDPETGKPSVDDIKMALANIGDIYREQIRDIE
ncbi:hypothetical protein [Methylocapsa aurea]|uniref:hypothetical protein n=1 Tax=Methylocapsa aurea TaxID=663610 RepID=UPI0005665922|nr:hypothetical protein [Methylocapsa aurea]